MFLQPSHLLWVKLLQPRSIVYISAQPSYLDRAPDTQLAAAEHWDHSVTPVPEVLLCSGVIVGSPRKCVRISTAALAGSGSGCPMLHGAVALAVAFFALWFERDQSLLVSPSGELLILLCWEREPGKLSAFPSSVCAPRAPQESCNGSHHGWCLWRGKLWNGRVNWMSYTVLHVQVCHNFTTLSEWKVLWFEGPEPFLPLSWAFMWLSVNVSTDEIFFSSCARILEMEIFEDLFLEQSAQWAWFHSPRTVMTYLKADLSKELLSVLHHLWCAIL